MTVLSTCFLDASWFPSLLAVSRFSTSCCYRLSCHYCRSWVTCILPDRTEVTLRTVLKSLQQSSKLSWFSFLLRSMPHSMPRSMLSWVPTCSYQNSTRCRRSYQSSCCDGSRNSVRYDGSGNSGRNDGSKALMVRREFRTCSSVHVLKRFHKVEHLNCVGQ